MIRQDFQQAFEKVDCIVSPTTPQPAHLLGALKDDPLAAYLEDIFTIPANLAGLPALSLPCGEVIPQPGEPALPVGLQLIGKPMDEARLLQISAALEQALA